MSQSDVWLKAFLAAIGGACADSNCQDPVSAALWAGRVADNAVKVAGQRLDLVIDVPNLGQKFQHGDES